MPRLLAEEDIDQVSDQLDVDMTKAEEEDALARFVPPSESSLDLSDGGRVGAAKLTPSYNGRPQAKGRPSARRAWSWNGTETTLPLAWNPDGTQNDGGRKYLTKRHCLCCQQGGFRGPQCPNCVKVNCAECQASTSQKARTLPNGQEIRGNIIPSFYLSKEKVPYPTRFYGDVPCMIESCIRQGSRGFKTEEEMRLHARLRHRMEYQVRQESIAARGSTDTQELRAEVERLRAQMQRNGSGASNEPKKRLKRRAKRTPSAGLKEQEISANATG